MKREEEEITVLPVRERVRVRVFVIMKDELRCRLEKEEMLMWGRTRADKILVFL